MKVLRCREAVIGAVGRTLLFYFLRFNAADLHKTGYSGYDKMRAHTPPGRMGLQDLPNIFGLRWNINGEFAVNRSRLPLQ